MAVCKEIDSLNRKFLWGSTDNKQKVPLVKWDMVCRPRKEGGLSFRKTADMNLALLAKLGWKLEANDNSLWAHALKAKYFKGSTFLQSPSKPVASHTWRSICASKNIVKQGCSRLVGMRKFRII